MWRTVGFAFIARFADAVGLLRYKSNPLLTYFLNVCVGRFYDYLRNTEACVLYRHFLEEETFIENVLLIRHKIN